MNKDDFNNIKNKFLDTLKTLLIKDDLEDQTKKSILRLSSILNNYTFENRNQMKGTLSHTIVDSIDFNHDVCEDLIEFDKSI